MASRLKAWPRESGSICSPQTLCVAFKNASAASESIAVLGYVPANATVVTVLRTKSVLLSRNSTRMVEVLACVPVVTVSPSTVAVLMAVPLIEVRTTSPAVSLFSADRVVNVMPLRVKVLAVNAPRTVAEASARGL